jgi:hypothetical protein
MASLFKETASIKREGIVYPKRVILANFSHGSISIKDGIEETFIMPEGMSVKRGNASVPGVCNFISGDANAYFAKTINSYKRKLETIPFANIDREFKVILDIFEKYDRKDTYDGLKPMVQKRATITAEEIGVETDEDKKDYLTEAKKYIDTYDSFFRMATYLPGERVIDKLFTRTNAEAVNTPLSVEWVCLIINLENITGPPYQDLFTLMNAQTRGGTINISLSKIVKFLQDKGVEEIIIFDNSCSVFFDEDNEQPSDRDIRARRQSLLKGSPGKFGGKTKKRRRQKRSKNKTKNKTKKSRKRV